MTRQQYSRGVERSASYTQEFLREAYGNGQNGRLGYNKFLRRNHWQSRLERETRPLGGCRVERHSVPDETRNLNVSEFCAKQKKRYNYRKKFLSKKSCITVKTFYRNVSCLNKFMNKRKEQYICCDTQGDYLIIEYGFIVNPYSHSVNPA